MRSAFHINGEKSESITHEPFYVLNLPIERDCYSVNDCLKAYFQDKKINDYEVNGRRVQGSHS